MAVGLLIKNGSLVVVDPDSGRDELLEVAISGGRIAEVAAGTPVAGAAR